MLLKEEIERILKRHGAVKAAIVEAAEAEPEATRRFTEWIEGGHAAGMDYLRNYPEIRKDPRLLLPGARSMICCAFSFSPPELRDSSFGHIAAYAYGDDYHDVIRRRLTEAVAEIDTLLGDGKAGDDTRLDRQRWRICVDSAPVMERYWAEKSCLGRRCRNGMISVPGFGQQVFLAEILSVNDIYMLARKGGTDESGNEECKACDICVSVCPGGALRKDGTVDAGRCISYLSIEHRGEWDETGRRVMATEAGRNTIYGCDRCLTSCPLNKDLPFTEITEFRLRDSLRTLKREEIIEMNQEKFSHVFRKSSIKRAKVSGLKRNTGPR